MPAVQAPAARRGATTAGASPCRTGTSSRSTSTSCCASASRPRASVIARVPSRCRGSGSRRSTTRTCWTRIRDGEMSLREQRGLGLPWSEVLVERGRRSVGGTLAARAARARARASAMNLGGGTHHAGRDFAPRLLPVQRRRGDGRARCAPRAWRGARWSSTATSTRATARRRSSAPIPTRSRCRCTARATTRSRGSRPTSTSTCRRAPATTSTCGALDRARRRARTRDFDVAFYLAGADPWEGDRLGRLALTKRRPARPRRARPATACGAASRSSSCSPAATRRTSRDTVDINAATVAACSRGRPKLRAVPGA